jgi:hypothetical protein
MFMNFVDEISSYLDRAGGDVDFSVHERFTRLCYGLFTERQAAFDFFSDYIDVRLKNAIGTTGKSFRHENGFTKLSLYKFPNEAQLRLHIWPAAAFADSTIHSHRWSFSSFMIRGALEGINYSTAPQGFNSARGIPSTLYRLSDAASDGKKDWQHLESVTIREVSAYKIGPGESHLLEYTVLHKIRKEAGETAFTLMLAGVPQRDFSIASMPPEKSVNTKGRDFIEPAQVAGILSAHFGPIS